MSQCTQIYHHNRKQCQLLENRPISARFCDYYGTLQSKRGKLKYFFHISNTSRKLQVLWYRVLLSLFFSFCLSGISTQSLCLFHLPLLSTNLYLFFFRSDVSARFPFFLKNLLLFLADRYPYRFVPHLLYWFSILYLLQLLRILSMLQKGCLCFLCFFMSFP